jgi:hypothetical protein
MSDWVEREIAASSMEDVRHKNRLKKVLQSLSDKPAQSAGRVSLSREPKG